MGLLRLLTNPTVMGRSPRTIAQAWEILTERRGDRRIVFAIEPDGVDSIWRQLMTRPPVGPSSWTDAYLAAFSQKHEYLLVTFDAVFARWADLRLTLLFFPTDSASK